MYECFFCFYAAKIPFPLTQRFRSMLQNGIDLSTVDVSYVSSRSWYLPNSWLWSYLVTLRLFDLSRHVCLFIWLCLITQSHVSQVLSQSVWIERLVQSHSGWRKWLVLTASFCFKQVSTNKYDHYMMVFFMLYNCMSGSDHTCNCRKFIRLVY